MFRKRPADRLQAIAYLEQLVLPLVARARDHVRAEGGDLHLFVRHQLECRLGCIIPTRRRLGFRWAIDGGECPVDQRQEVGLDPALLHANFAQGFEIVCLVRVAVCAAGEIEKNVVTRAERAVEQRSQTVERDLGDLGKKCTAGLRVGGWRADVRLLVAHPVEYHAVGSMPSIQSVRFAGDLRRGVWC